MIVPMEYVEGVKVMREGCSLYLQVASEIKKIVSEEIQNDKRRERLEKKFNKLTDEIKKTDKNIKFYDKEIVESSEVSDETIDRMLNEADNFEVYSTTIVKLMEITKSYLYDDRRRGQRRRAGSGRWQSGMGDGKRYVFCTFAGRICIHFMERQRSCTGSGRCYEDYSTRFI